MRINQTGVLNEKKKFYRVYGRTVAPPQENIAGIPFTFLDLKKEERKQTDWRRKIATYEKSKTKKREIKKKNKAVGRKGRDLEVQEDSSPDFLP